MSRRLLFNKGQFGEHDYNLLRTGAIATSRSVLSRNELIEEGIVDVGEGAVANVYERLMARLEQHGLRRVFINSYNQDVDCDDTRSRNDLDGGCDGPFNTSGEHKNQKSQNFGGGERVPYYYMCVPCELQLCETSEVPATMKMLQDAHYHFSSAEHRCIASWMGDQDIDLTLSTTAQLDPGGYSRIYVNGIPILIPKRPGGGDMFYPLPHEREENGKHPLGRDMGEMVQSRRKLAWYRPLQSMFTGCKQLVYAADSRKNFRLKWAMSRSHRHNGVVVLHVPIESYCSESFLQNQVVPAIFEVGRKRMPKKSSSREKPSGFRARYVMSETPLMTWSNVGPQSDVYDFLNVKDEGVYRLAMLQLRGDEKQTVGHLMMDSEVESVMVDDEAPVLTVEALQSIGGGMRGNTSVGDETILSSQISSSPICSSISD